MLITNPKEVKEYQNIIKQLYKYNNDRIKFTHYLIEEYKDMDNLYKEARKTIKIGNKILETIYTNAGLLLRKNIRLCVEYFE